MGKKIEIIDKVFDDLKVLKLDKERSTQKKKYYICKCLICGREYSKRKDAITSYTGTKHKACVYLIEEDIDEKFKHAWENMRARTNNPNFHQYKDYGARGINSDEFENFIDFYDALYESYKESIKINGPENTTLDRINTNESYKIDNVRWVSHKKQNENLTTTFKVYAISKSIENDIIIFESLKDAGNYFNIHHNLIKERALYPNKKFKRDLGYEFRIEKKY